MDTIIHNRRASDVVTPQPAPTELSPNLAAVLLAIHLLSRQRGYSPSYLEIGAATSSNPNAGTVRRHVGSLAAGGWVNWQPSVARSVSLTTKGKRALAVLKRRAAKNGVKP